ncbi:GDSL esterase/lipase [Thalictrum thalictroides]|uniref:GDSL esterase/lipase n=1 Tax=Thalictrum thalictroides TaxID=46969 RepID=A0A7J6UU40_THATH|nr:GDSL esterase/lipase [Thalictrum thalictroides]
MAGELKKMWGVLFVLILASVQNLNTSVMGQKFGRGPRFGGGRIPGIGGGRGPRFGRGPGIGGGRGPGIGGGGGPGIGGGGGGGSQVPCYFIFGDSLVDNGNNNNIASLARANYLPYGIDFPGGPTGRFSNSLTSVDVIAQQLGFNNFIPPYAQARGRAILGGVNYASAAAGIRDETGQQLGDRIAFNGQLRNYQNTVQQVVSILGDENTAANYLSRCIYSVGLGNNDYLNNYFMPAIYPTSRQYTPAQYANVLIQQYTQQIRTLYNYGARKVAIIGVGFTVTNSGCCGIGRNNGQITCLPFQPPCQNRDQHVFWDAFHPTSAANIVIGRRSYSAQTSNDAYPIDIRRLAQL